MRSLPRPVLLSAVVLLPSLALAADFAEAGPLPMSGQSNVSVALSDATVEVDLYWPNVSGTFPVVTVAHGLGGSKEGFVEWGKHLASWGFVVVVPQFLNRLNPNHERNARHLRELIDEWVPDQNGRVLSPLGQRVRLGEAGMVGHSFGALASALALPDRPSSVAVLLDLADADGRARAVSPGYVDPVAFLFAPPVLCNQSGNGRQVADVAGGPLFRFQVVNANHCDPQHPSDVDLGCRTTCGQPNLPRHRVFRGYGTAWLRYFLHRDADAEEWIGGQRLESDQPDRIAEVLLHRVPTLEELEQDPQPDPDDELDLPDPEDPRPDGGDPDDDIVDPEPPDAGEVDGGDDVPDAGDGGAPPVNEEFGAIAGGCDCAGAGVPVAWAVMLAALLLSRRRHAGRGRWR